MGSSPHTRGARCRARAGRGPVGIIPAYAGSTPPASLVGPTPSDHPRIRGEHITDKEPATPTQGSSPHTRGARVHQTTMTTKRGIIPAYAGSTMVVVSSTGRRRDHPRIRGEHPTDIDGRSQQSGSSPHTRGAPAEDVDALQLARIIPAYAGSTATFRTVLYAQRDHPRIRGEHAPGSCATSPTWGSSPHTRGARGDDLFADELHGIIPAYAGSTPGSSTPGAGLRDHPRIRGEHRYVVLAGVVEHGIIPAYAGSTTPPRRRGLLVQDHPRIRGEHTSALREVFGGHGSSPHTRGAPIITRKAK